MRFCGNCGAPVDRAVRVTGVCATCGTPIAPSGDVVDTHSTPATLAAALQLAPSQPAYSGPPPAPGVPVPRWPMPGAQHAPRPRRGCSGLAVVAAIAVVALLTTALLTLASRPRQGRANAQPSPTASLASPTQTAVPATATSTPSPAPTDSPTAAPTDSPTAADTPVLAVSPSDISAVPCLDTTESFTVSNVGGGSLDWTATASDATYQIDPASGTLAGGDPPQTVTVSHISLPGTVTITADGADGSPQVVRFQCI